MSNTIWIINTVQVFSIVSPYIEFDLNAILQYFLKLKLSHSKRANLPPCYHCPSGKIRLNLISLVSFISTSTTISGLIHLIESLKSSFFPFTTSPSAVLDIIMILTFASLKIPNLSGAVAGLVCSL